MRRVALEIAAVEKSKVGRVSEESPKQVKNKSKSVTKSLASRVKKRGGKGKWRAHSVRSMADGKRSEEG
jgi:hypothetical protein